MHQCLQAQNHSEFLNEGWLCGLWHSEISHPLYHTPNCRQSLFVPPWWCHFYWKAPLTCRSVVCLGWDASVCKLKAFVWEMCLEQLLSLIQKQEGSFPSRLCSDFSSCSFLKSTHIAAGTCAQLLTPLSAASEVIFLPGRRYCIRCMGQISTDSFVSLMCYLCASMYYLFKPCQPKG